MRIYESIKKGRITYVALPKMGKTETANSFAKMFVADVKKGMLVASARPGGSSQNAIALFYG